MKKYIIIPGCSDLNRGDQALVWETKIIAEQAGFVGEYYLTSEKNEPVGQSVAEGIKITPPLIEHPSRKFKSKENINYTKMLKIKWGVVAIGDLISSLFLLWKPTRNIAKLFLSSEKKKIIQLFEESDAIFMKGGGLLQTSGGLSSTYSMYFWTYPILFAHAIHKPVFVMPNSFGPFKGPFVRQIAKAALKKCKILTSRESLSQTMVKNELNLSSEVFADLAFMLKRAVLDKNEIFKKYNLPNNRKLVAITMRPYRFPENSNPAQAYENFKKQMADFIRWLYKNGMIAVIVEHTLAVNAHENDGACIKDVTLMLNKEEYRIISNPNMSCRELKTIYGLCDYIVGTRFHSVIFSFGCNIPGIAIAYVGNKSQGIMHDIGLDDFVIRIDQVSSAELIKKFTVLQKEEDMVRRKINNYLNKAENDWQKLVIRLREENDEISFCP